MFLDLCHQSSRFDLKFEQGKTNLFNNKLENYLNTSSNQINQKCKKAKKLFGPPDNRKVPKNFFKKKLKNRGVSNSLKIKHVPLSQFLRLAVMRC